MISLRTALPIQLVRGQTQTLLPGIMWDGEDVVPLNPSNITIRDSNGEAIVDYQTFNPSSGYTMLSSVTRDLALGENWQVEWEVSLSESGKTHTLTQDCALVRRPLFPVIGDGDLFARHSDLANQLPPDQTTWGEQIEEAWLVIQSRLLAQGRRPWLVMSPWSFREAHIYLTLSLVFRDLSTYSTGRGKYAEMASDYMDQFEGRWDKMTFTYDLDEDGQSDSDEQGVAGPSVIYLV